MLDFLSTHPEYIYVPVITCLGFFLFRHLFLKKKIWIVGYYTVMFFLFNMALNLWDDFRWDGLYGLHVQVITCLVFFLFRRLFLKKKIWIVGYHAVLLFFFFIGIIGGVGAYNDACKRLEKFKEIEKYPSPDKQKLICQQKDSMLALDFELFKNSSEFSDYIKHQDKMVESIEKMCIGWLGFLYIELGMIVIAVCRYIIRKIKHLFYPPPVS